LKLSTEQLEKYIEKSEPISGDDSIIPYGYDLFEHMEREHGLTLVASELNEIIRIVKSIIDPKSKTPAEKPDHALPRCKHGNALRDHGGNRLYPSCGCWISNAPG